MILRSADSGGKEISSKLPWCSVNDVRCVNRGFVVFGDAVIIEEQSLYAEMVLIVRNVHTILGSNVSLQSYHEVHRKIRYG